MAEELTSEEEVELDRQIYRAERLEVKKKERRQAKANKFWTQCAGAKIRQRKEGDAAEGPFTGSELDPETRENWVKWAPAQIYKPMPSGMTKEDKDAFKR